MSQAAAVPQSAAAMQDSWRKYVVLAAFCVMLFLITAGTYSSLGVVLPHMVQELGWSWRDAGLGFTLLGVFTGASSLVPAFLIRKVGVRSTLFIGAVVQGCGFVLLALADMPFAYFVGAALCGVGYQMTALVPGTHVLGSLFANKTRIFGIYFTFGSVGGICGPWMVVAIMGDTATGGDWRLYWAIQAALAVMVGAAVAFAVGSTRWLKSHAISEQEDVEEAKEANPAVFRTSEDWTVKQAIRTPQFAILVAAYFMHLLSGVTVASLSVAHLGEIGVGAAVAAAMLSIESLFGAGSRLLGGAIGDRLDPKYILVVSQLFTMLGLLAIGSGLTSYSVLLVYAVGTGAGFGLTVLACTVLLINYFGRKNYLELFSITCLAGAFSASGPFIGGLMRDSLGSFAPTFQLFAAIAGIVTIAAIFMRPPALDKNARVAVKTTTAAEQG